MIGWHFEVSKTSSKQVIQSQLDAQTVVLIHVLVWGWRVPQYKVPATILLAKGRRRKKKST